MIEICTKYFSLRNRRDRGWDVKGHVPEEVLKQRKLLWGKSKSSEGDEGAAAEQVEFIGFFSKSAYFPGSLFLVDRSEAEKRWSVEQRDCSQRGRRETGQ